MKSLSYRSLAPMASAVNRHLPRRGGRRPDGPGGGQRGPRARCPRGRGARGLCRQYLDSDLGQRFAGHRHHCVVAGTRTQARNCPARPSPSTATWRPRHAGRDHRWRRHRRRLGRAVPSEWLGRLRSVRSPTPRPGARLREVLDNARRVAARDYMTAPFHPEGTAEFFTTDLEERRRLCADWIQESVPERLEIKHKVLACAPGEYGAGNGGHRLVDLGVQAIGTARAAGAIAARSSSRIRSTRSTCCH